MSVSAIEVYHMPCVPLTPFARIATASPETAQ